MKAGHGLEVAQRLAALGVDIRSPELQDEQKRLEEFAARGGNRALRRAAKKRARTQL